MYLYMMKIMKPLRERVWPLMTIRKRRWGVRLSEELGEAETKIRGLEEFRKNLPPFWKNLNRPCPSQRNFLRITGIYFESAEESLRTRAVFSGMLTDVVKIFETSPHSVGEGGAGLFTNTLYKTQSHPSTDKKLWKCRSECRKLFFFVCVTIVFFMETGSKLELYCEFFCPRFTDMTHNLCVSIAQKKIKIHTGKMPK